MGTLTNKIALVTGGGTGIGLSTAERFAAEGAHVYITGRREPELRDAADKIGDAVTAVPSDITIPGDLDRLFDLIGERGAGLDVLVANAGVGRLATLDALTEDDLDHVFDINVKGTVRTVQKALPHLNDGASIILMLSTAANFGLPSFGAYSASKAALRSFTRTWAAELKGRSIRVNAISPGAIDTPGVVDLVGADSVTAFQAGIAARTPLGRVGQPEEVAAAAAYLASSESSYMTGANLYVDGGRTQL